MPEKVTSLQVARRAGVSQSAVSRVFTPGASVSEKTAKKVRASADALGYRPNVLARSLITGRSKIIGLVVAYLDNQFYPDALERLSKALQEKGYHLLVFIASGGSDVDRLVDELMKAGKRFTYMPIPGSRHGYRNKQRAYYEKMMWYFFAEHLMGDYRSNVDINLPDQK